MEKVTVENYKKIAGKLLREGKVKECDMILNKFSKGWKEIVLVESK